MCANACATSPSPPSSKLSGALIIETLDVYYNPDDLIKPLVTMTSRGESEVHVGRDEADERRAPRTGPCCSSSSQSSCPLMQEKRRTLGPAASRISEGVSARARQRRTRSRD
mmetsp:Transcript_117054/g.327565  ORF Transcript_117054/g.327565 Transcript_117054/m.327565 type:complete len:112 (+) Transcript_117054:427-762(+)